VIGRKALHAGQLRALQAIFVQHALITLLIAGIRGGKTEVGALASILYALEHPTGEDEYHLACSPTYPMSIVPEEKLLATLWDKKVFPANPLIAYKKRDRVMVLAARDGRVTRIKIVSMHEPGRLRGLKALSAWGDEAAMWAVEAWLILLGRLADVNGPAWLTTTPDGMNWLYDLVQKAETDETIRVIRFSSLDNPFISRPGFVRLSDHYDEDTYNQEVNAQFVKPKGIIYRAFDRKTHVQPWRFNRRAPIEVGQDFNVSPMASVLAQPFRTAAGTDGLHVFAERFADDSDTYELAEDLLKLADRWHVPKERWSIFPDASGKARKTSAKKSDLQILRDAGFSIRARKRNPEVRDRVNTVNGLLMPRLSRVPRLLIDPSCVKLIESLERQKWLRDVSPPEPDKTGGYDHANDALGYLCFGRFPLEPRTTLAPPRKAA
jgi:hypothetical protein